MSCWGREGVTNRRKGFSIWSYTISTNLLFFFSSYFFFFVWKLFIFVDFVFFLLRFCRYLFNLSHSMPKCASLFLCVQSEMHTWKSLFLYTSNKTLNVENFVELVHSSSKKKEKSKRNGKKIPPTLNIRFV